MSLIKNVGNPISRSRKNIIPSRIVRVFDIVLNDKHPLFSDIPYDPTLIGLILYGEKDLNVGAVDTLALSRALPINRSFLPLINELVEIEEGPSSFIYSTMGGRNQFNFTYYTPPLPVHSNPIHNALPRESDLIGNSNSNPENPNSTPPQIILDNTENFEEKPKISLLQPFAGDKIIEGRSGQSIRFGTTNREGQNPWSDGSEMGDPIIIQRLGKFEGPQRGTHIEDINEDYVSIYMTSNQVVNNIKLTSTNFDSLNSEYKEPNPPAPDQLSTAPIESIINTIPTSEFIDFENQTPIEEIMPLPVTSSLATGGDPIFNALDEAIEEDLISEQVYSFELEEPTKSAAAEAIDVEGATVEINPGLFTIYPTAGDHKETIPVEDLTNPPSYLPVYKGSSRNWTSISPEQFAKRINLSSEADRDLKIATLFISLKEQSKGGNIGGFNYNHYGIMSDLGRWGNGDLINGSVSSTEGSGGEGTRTSHWRYFASFKNEQQGILFMVRTLRDKAKKSKERKVEGKTVSYIAGSINRNNIADFYILKWLAPGNAVVKKRLITNRSQTIAQYQKIWDRASKLIDNN